MAHTTSPALHADDGVATVENLELHGVGDAPGETTVDILLPWNLVEVGLLLGEVEGIHAAIEMGILNYISPLFRLMDDHGRLLTLAARLFLVTMMMGHTGRYLERRRAELPLYYVSMHFSI